MTEEEKSFEISTHSYLNIMPPPNCWNNIQKLRQKYTNGMKTGPHITLVQPFFAEKHIDEITQILTKEFQDIEPFKVVLANFKNFKMKKGCVLWLDPETSEDLPIHKIVSKFLKIFPNFEKNPKCTNFVPHLSVGDFGHEDKMKDALETSQCKKWKPIEFEVKEIYFMTLNTTKGIYEVRATIPLGRNPTKPHFSNVPIDQPKQ